MNTHQLQLNAELFNAISSGQKTIESRLYDEKRQLIQLGDEIIFISREDPAQTVTVTVVGLLRYDTFGSLFRHNELSKLGGESVEQLESQISKFYSIDEQRKNGVIGIEFERT